MEGNLGRLQRFVGRVWGEVTSPLYRNAIFLMFSSIIGLGLGFFFWWVVYRVYPNPDDWGFAVTLVNAVTFLTGVATFGMPVAIIRFLPESDDKEALLNTTLTIAGLAAIGLIVVFMLGINVWAASLKPILERPEYPILLILSTMVFALGPLLDQSTIALRRADLFTWRILIFSLVKIPLPIIFVLWFGNVLGGRLGIYLSWAVGYSLSVLIAVFVFLPRVIPHYRPRPRTGVHRIRPMFGFSVGNWVAGIVASAGTNLLPLLIANTFVAAPRVTPLGAAAVWYAATLIAGILYIIPQATMTSFFAEASQRHARRRRDERKAVLLSLGLLIPGIIGMWFLAGPLLGLFDLKQYQDLGTEPLRILSLGAIPVFLNAILGTRVRVRKQVVPIIVSTIISTAVTIGLGVVFIKWMGLDGLAIAVVLGQVAPTPYLIKVAGEPMEIEPIEPTPTPP